MIQSLIGVLILIDRNIISLFLCTIKRSQLMLLPVRIRMYSKLICTVNERLKMKMRIWILTDN